MKIYHTKAATNTIYIRKKLNLICESESYILPNVYDLFKKAMDNIYLEDRDRLADKLNVPRLPSLEFKYRVGRHTERVVFKETAV